MGMINFDASKVAPAVSLDPLPENWYKTIIKKSNIVPTKDNSGMMLKLELSVIEGQYSGRSLYWNLNLFNNSQQAVEIANKQLSAICHVVGQQHVASQDNVVDNVTPNLHNVPFLASVTVEKTDRGTLNNIRGVKDVNGNEPGKANAGPPMQQPAGPQFGAPQSQPGFQAPGGYVPQAQQQPAAPPPQQWQPSPPTAPAAQQPQAWGQPQPQVQQQQPQQQQPMQQPQPWNGGAPQQATQPAQQPQQQPAQWQAPQQGAPPPNAPWNGPR